ncbi:DNA repair protein RadC [Alishewanella sp. 16-MA]|uniref:DNA repair protein RadC n=1 Tax=Alishewanella maricola TaxID=2795740 RepID=A0ABS8BZK5_9ALTE|nr:DNA repair protein RadC [Alishewanella maricola]MCB5225230.1 DNA repair protein RadC [Alishewanella maricola]MDP4944404.1 DNA repair protein RadC [Alishewanella sp.]MDP5035487.1 DNA repair protein RadC [Alishewanella sp.]MDP5188213.1 DNA repair protein RadC [Alishewanella sp.]
MAITDWPLSERPREKMLQLGTQALSDAELLAIFLRTGIAGTDAVGLARQLLQQFGSLRALLGASKAEFCQARGLGEAKYVQLQAVLELSRRFLQQQLQRETVFTEPALVRKYLSSLLSQEQREIFMVLYLDNQHRMICAEPLFQGTIDASPVYPRIVVQHALRHNAAAVILAHNHPSGVAEPSRADRAITERLTQAMALVDIRVLDHFVVGDAEVVSFAERGWL